MERGARWLVFNAVGAIGLIVQLGWLWLLRGGLGMNYLLATAVAIELTIVHNFVWHVRWTWRDRPAQAPEIAGRLLRFNLTNGAISIFGNLGLMTVLVEVARLHYLLANVIAVIGCSLANFVVSDVVVFVRRAREAPRLRPS